MELAIESALRTHSLIRLMRHAHPCAGSYMSAIVPTPMSAIVPTRIFMRARTCPLLCPRASSCALVHVRYCAHAHLHARSYMSAIVPTRIFVRARTCPLLCPRASSCALVYVRYCAHAHLRARPYEPAILLTSNLERSGTGPRLCLPLNERRQSCAQMHI
jgi:hypothetical protein